MLKDLVVGFDMFMELKNNLEEGIKVNYCNILVIIVNNVSNIYKNDISYKCKNVSNIWKKKY